MKTTIDNRNKQIISKWQKTCERLMTKLDKKIVRDFENIRNNNQVIDLKKNIFKFDPEKEYSGRDMSYHILNKLDNKDIFCLTTDTKSSTKVYFKNSSDFTKKNRLEKNLLGGVRELGVSAIQNGLALLGIRTVSSSFLSFANYMIPSIRMASLMKLPTIYVFTHDSVLVGEDGPTHQPIEQIDMLRSIPGVTVLRPCDRNEMIGAYKYAFKENHPCVIVASKETLISLENTDINKVESGGYELISDEKPKVCLIASGREVALALEISNSLEKNRISSKVVSMPSLEQFSKLKKEEQEKILPKNAIKVVLELSSCLHYYKYLSTDDLVFNVTDFMKSGNKYSILSRLSYDVDTITKEIILNLKQRK